MPAWPMKFVCSGPAKYEQETASSRPAAAVEEASTPFEVATMQEQEILGASSEPDK